MPRETTKSVAIRSSAAEFLIFTHQVGGDSIEVRYQDETIWLTQKMMAELFGVSVPTINEHLGNIFKSGELAPDAVIRKFRITAADGKTYNTQFYDLDAIISVGYRVNSIRATQFRRWATQVLREYAIKGYVLDKERMERGAFLGEDYFERLLAEILRTWDEAIEKLEGLKAAKERYRNWLCSHLISLGEQDAPHVTFGEYLTRPAFYSQQVHLARGQRKARRIAPDDFLASYVRLPNQTEQDRIVEILAQADRELNLEAQTLKLIRDQKRGLMQKLLTGEWRVLVEGRHD